MKRSELNLRRLLRAASRAEQTVPEDVPFGFEARCLEAWRCSLQAGEDFLDWLRLFKRSVLWACFIMILSIVLGYPALSSEPSDELAIADSVIQMSYTP